MVISPCAVEPAWEGFGSVIGSHACVGTDWPAQMEPALIDPPPQFGDRCPLRVIGDRRGLSDGVGLDRVDPRAPAEHRFDDRLLGCPVQAARVQDDGRSRLAAVLPVVMARVANHVMWSVRRCTHPSRSKYAASPPMVSGLLQVAGRCVTATS